MKKLIPSILMVALLGLGACNNQSGDSPSATGESSTADFGSSTETGTGTALTEGQSTGIDFQRYAVYINEEEAKVRSQAQTFGLASLNSSTIDLSTGNSFANFFFATDFKFKANVYLSQIAFFRAVFKPAVDFKAVNFNLAAIVNNYLNLKRVFLADASFTGVAITNPNPNSEELKNISLTLKEKIAYIFKDVTFQDGEREQINSLIEVLAFAISYQVNNELYILNIEYLDKGMDFKFIKAKNLEGFKPAADEKIIESWYGDLRLDIENKFNLIEEGKTIYWVQVTQIENLIKIIRENLASFSKGADWGPSGDQDGKLKSLQDQQNEIKAHIAELEAKLNFLPAGDLEIESIKEEIEKLNAEYTEIQKEIENIQSAPPPANSRILNNWESLKAEAEKIEKQLQELEATGQGDSEEAKKLQAELEKIKATLEKYGK